MTASLHPPAKRARLSALAVLLAWSLSYPAVAAAEEVITEYRVKAAFLYNFLHFVSWPVPHENTFRLCVIGENPFGESLDSLIGKPVHNGILVVEQHSSPENIHDCQLVFISYSLQSRLDMMLAELADRPILTVSDIDAFSDAGGMIELRLADNKVRFEINASAADRAGLTISSKLLSLATRVKTGQ
jgi:hypothetical protein